MSEWMLEGGDRTDVVVVGVDEVGFELVGL